MLTYNIINIFKLTSLHLFNLTATNKLNSITVSQTLWSIVTVKEIYNTILASGPRCRLIRPSVHVKLTYNIINIFKLTSLHLFYFTASIKLNIITVSQLLWSISTVKEDYNTISASWPRCRLICPSVFVKLTNNIINIIIFASTSFVLSHRFK